MRALYIIFIVATAASSCPLCLGQEDSLDFPELQDKWQRLSDNVDVDEVPFTHTKPSIQDDSAGSTGATVHEPTGVQVTDSLLSWISSQCENMIEEIEAIAKQNAVAKAFSPVNYLRYLFLYERLGAIAKQPLPKLKWVKRKVNIFGSVYKQTISFLRSYLEDQNIKLMKVEDGEPKGKQVAVSKSWLEHYRNIRYIAVHAPKNSELAKRAIELLAYSPDSNPIRQRSARYEVKTRAFSR